MILLVILLFNDKHMPSYKIINTPSKYTGGIQEEGQRGGAEIGRYKYILIKEIN